VRELTALGLGEKLARGVLTAELAFYNKHGQRIWTEPRGRDAGSSGCSLPPCVPFASLVPGLCLPSAPLVREVQDWGGGPTCVADLSRR
jgi:hypothetical protein